MSKIPDEKGFQYEPKWDGFRAIIYRQKDRVLIQSKPGNVLNHYFPELEAAILKVKKQVFVLDGEIVIFIKNEISFADLQLPLHPAASRIQRLAKETPVNFQCFDLLYDRDIKRGEYFAILAVANR